MPEEEAKPPARRSGLRDLIDHDGSITAGHLNSAAAAIEWEMPEYYHPDIHGSKTKRKDPLDEPFF